MFRFFKDEEAKRLESVLKTKNFDETGANIISSWMYKLRGNYKDYKKIVVLVPDKTEYILNEIEVLNKYVNNISFLNNPNEMEYFEKEKALLCFFKNEKSFHLALGKAHNLKIEIKDDILKDFTNEINNIFILGNKELRFEIFNNFNSFAWHNELKRDNLEYLILYIMLWLLGPKYMYSKINSEYIVFEELSNRFKEIYGLESYLNMYINFTKILMIYKKMSEYNLKLWNERNKNNKSRESLNNIEIKEEDLNNELNNILEKIRNEKDILEKIPQDFEKRQKNIVELTKKINDLDFVLKDKKVLEEVFKKYLEKSKEKINIEKYKIKLIENRGELEGKLILNKTYVKNEVDFRIQELEILEKNLIEVINTNISDYILDYEEKYLKYEEKVSEYKLANQILEIDKDKNINVKKTLPHIFIDENIKRKILKDSVLEFLETALYIKKNFIETLNEYNYMFFEMQIERYLMQFKVDIDEKGNFEYIKDTMCFNLIYAFIHIILSKMQAINKITRITANDELNRAIIIEVLKTQIIDFEDIKVDVNKILGKMTINFYDKDIWQAETGISLKNDIPILIKEGVKYKLFK